MPGSSTFRLHSVRLAEHKNEVATKSTRLVLDIPHNEQNRVGLQSLELILSRAEKDSMRIDVTVPDQLAQ